MRRVMVPDGTEHGVRIEWIGSRVRRAPGTLRRRVRRTTKHADAVPDVGCAGDLGEFFAVFFAIVAIVVVLLFVLPTLFWLIEVLIVLVLAVGIWAFRVLFRRPWRVVHTATLESGGDEDVVEECLVVGWRRAHATMVDAAAEVAATGSATSTFAAAKIIG